jgi:hypothetical protein
MTTYGVYYAYVCNQKKNERKKRSIKREGKKKVENLMGIESRKINSKGEKNQWKGKKLRKAKSHNLKLKNLNVKIP